MKKNFKPGDVIEFAKDKFRVLENHGESGVVQEYPSGDINNNFRWYFDGEECILSEESPTGDVQKYFYWDKPNLQAEAIKFSHVLARIKSIAGNNCAGCPKEKPQDEGCGLSECLNQILKMA